MHPILVALPFLLALVGVAACGILGTWAGLRETVAKPKASVASLSLFGDEQASMATVLLGSFALLFAIGGFLGVVHGKGDTSLLVAYCLAMLAAGMCYHGLACGRRTAKGNP